MENLDQLVKKARELLQEMGEVLATLNTKIIAEADDRAPEIEIGTPADDPEASDKNGHHINK
jgi:hypothetical protein